ncbi:hypothetical protein Hanom_Chr16g01483741 [Helianthus anomalus]
MNSSADFDVASAAHRNTHRKTVALLQFTTLSIYQFNININIKRQHFFKQSSTKQSYHIRNSSSRAQAVHHHHRPYRHPASHRDPASPSSHRSPSYTKPDSHQYS